MDATGLTTRDKPPTTTTDNTNTIKTPDKTHQNLKQTPPKPQTTTSDQLHENPRPQTPPKPHHNLRPIPPNPQTKSTRN
ncbi:hypothetical protein Pmani_021845 [Petrolisthes manimaculis]|uniref:Uncharacterized protein n=1 Tax=Petrolisthes manimaculis TaxID=1843537 RepID=A0AAE1PE25_9EUCA|nr:hypothetical protein Pmani_021845 [Petrolisthes manimaculis]